MARCLDGVARPVPPHIPADLKARELQQWLRTALRTLLDVKLNGRPTVGGKIVVLSNEDMKECYELRREAMMGAVKRDEWLASRAGVVPYPESPLRRLVYFWHGLGAPEGKLPQACLDGLTSAVRNSGMECILLSFQDMVGLPQGVDAVTTAL